MKGDGKHIHYRKIYFNCQQKQDYKKEATNKGEIYSIQTQK